MLLNISEHAKSLSKTEGDTITPPKQLLMQMLDLLSFHEQSSEVGLFDFIKKYFVKK